MLSAVGCNRLLICYSFLSEVFDCVFDYLSPFAAADDEWINGYQQGELFERSEFSHCRRSSF